MSAIFTNEEVARHNKADDAWLIIQGDVYDVSKFVAMHPGGAKVILQYAGKESTDVFYSYHRADVLDKYARFKIGRLDSAGDADEDNTITSRAVISKVPYAESTHWRNLPSPYYNDSHDRFRLAVREFVDKEIRKDAEKAELSGKPPTDEIYRKMGEFGLLAARIGPGKHMNIPASLPGGVKPEQFDYFHEMIAHEEIARICCPGYADGLGAGMVIGLPPVLQFGPKWMKQKVAKEVLSGEKRICLAISEPSAGSDVANLMCTAAKTPCGKFYIVNGQKKWITNGCDAHYFVTAVRTGKPGMGGVSLLLIERGPGLETRRIKTAYSTSAGTAYVNFEDCKVPVENLIGKENKGFLSIMYNFNHERWMIVCYVVSGIRMVVEETFKWVNQRRAFGKTLAQQPVVRQKMARMVAELEAVHAWTEQITYQMNKMNYAEMSMRLAGTMSLLKYHCTRVANITADSSVQIFGGRGITMTGMGMYIERFNRTYKFGSILGGSEEIMADLGIKLANKQMPRLAKL